TPRGTTAARGAAMRQLQVIDDGVLVVDDGRFAYVGSESAMPDAIKRGINHDVDARGATALPGFVDSHTHIPFAGFRESEFNRRLQGETYTQIAQSGGGIASSVRATRAASEDELVSNVLKRGKTMARYG